MKLNRFSSKIIAQDKGDETWEYNTMITVNKTNEESASTRRRMDETDRQQTD